MSPGRLFSPLLLREMPRTSAVLERFPPYIAPFKNENA
jgi:hypothetical protein